MRRLLNLAYAVLIEGIPIELRGELDRRLNYEPSEATVEAPAELPREVAAAQNRKAMGQLIGMMPGSVRTV